MANAVEASERYAGSEIRAAEETRGEQRRALVLELRSRFVDGPGLLVPSGGGGTFNAVGATPIPGVGTVFVLPYRQRGNWGTLEATKGVLVNEDGARRLPGPVRIVRHDPHGRRLDGDCRPRLDRALRASVRRLPDHSRPAVVIANTKQGGWLTPRCTRRPPA
jgi:hypothetical protein